MLAYDYLYLRLVTAMPINNQRPALWDNQTLVTARLSVRS